ncbi:MAG: DUF2155 domain-containing protein [Pseudomonadota bacterium]
MRAALIACLIATPLVAQDGSSLPVFPAPSDALPQVRERTLPTISDTARPGINVVPRAVWGTRPRPRPVEGGARVVSPNRSDAAVPATADAGDTLPGLTDRVEQSLEAAATVTPTILPAPQTPTTGGAVFVQAPATPLARNRPRPRGAAPAVVAEEGLATLEVLVVEPEEPADDTIAPVVEDVLNALREETAESQTADGLPELRPAEEIISGAIVVETLGGSTSELLGLRPRSAPLEAVETAPGAVLRGLDKVSGIVRDIELSVGETARLGRLSVLLSECRYPVANPAGNAYAWLDITVDGLSDPAFQGWMLAASPALSALDHPRYDVWVIRCSTS